MTGTGWNPWRALRARPQSELVWQRLVGRSGAVEVTDDGHEIVILDPRLGRRDRRAVLAHEIVHLERRLLPVGTTDAVIDREEHQVREETARRLVPPTALAGFVAERVDVVPVTAELVADEFDVPVVVALRALDQLSRGRPGG